MAAIVGVVAAIVTAGISVGFSTLAAQGFSAITAGAWAVGGAVGGALAGGMEGGWRGALIGAATGGALGGLGGWAAGLNNGFGNAILGGMLAGGIANAAINDSWDSFTGGIVGAVAGGAVGMGAVKAKFGTLTDPQTAEAQVNQRLEQNTNSENIHGVNQQKGNPEAVAKGAKQIAQKAADTQTVVTEEILIVKVGPTAEPRNTSEALIRCNAPH